jgi:hypothetical protein
MVQTFGLFAWFYHLDDIFETGGRTFFPVSGNPPSAGAGPGLGHYA